MTEPDGMLSSYFESLRLLPAEGHWSNELHANMLPSRCHDTCETVNTVVCQTVEGVSKEIE